jgi:hypothetical protein
MIKEVDDALLEILKKGLSELLPSDNVVMGEPEGRKTRAVFLNCRDFTIEEMGIGGSAEVKSEKISKSIDADGVKLEFPLSNIPLRPLVSVESPPGTFRQEPDDYTMDYSRGIIKFRQPPAEGTTIHISYNLSRSVAEIRRLKFNQIYTITLWASEQEDRDRMTLEAIRVLYLGQSELGKRGIDEIQLIKGISQEDGKEKRRSSVLKYLVGTTLSIEVPQPAIERIEIEKT